MFGSGAYITGLTQVFHGDRLFRAGEVHDYSGPSRQCELILKTAGETRITFDGETFVDSCGSVRFLAETERHVRYISETLDAGEYILFGFHGSGFPDGLRRMKLSPQNTASLMTLYMKMYRLWTMRSAGYEHRCLALAYEILAELERAAYVPSAAAGRLEPALAYMAEHLTEPISVSGLHALCGISYTHFKSLFLRSFGVTPSRYVTSLRMKLACERLEEGRLSVTKVAESLGFSSVAYFSRAFRREYGCTAEEYKKKAHGGAL